jgi:hypothetical protein
MDFPLHRGGRPRKTVDTKQVAQLREQGLSFRKITKTLRLGEEQYGEHFLHRSDDIWPQLGKIKKIPKDQKLIPYVFA